LGTLRFENCNVLLAFLLVSKLTSQFSQLAAGDARKAQKLLTAMLEGKGVGLVARKELLETPTALKVPGFLQYHQPFLDKIVKEFHFKNFMTLASSLDQAGAFHSFREMCIGI